jgi:hypothetical protein
MTTLTPAQIDGRIIKSRRALARWARSGSEIDKARLETELGVLEGLAAMAPPEKKAKIEALIERYRPAD